MITCIKGHQNYLKMSLIKKAQNLREEAFKFPTGRYTKIISCQNQRPQTFMSMLNKVTTKRKQQIKQIKKRHQQQGTNMSCGLVGKPAPYQKLLKRRVKTQQQAEFVKSTTFYSQFHHFNESALKSKVSFGIKNKRLSMTNNCQRIWRGSNVNRRSSNDQSKIWKQQKKQDKRQKTSQSPKDETLQFKPVGNIKRKYTEGNKKYYQNQFEFKNLDIFLVENEKKRQQQVQDEPLKRIYDKIQKCKNQEIKYRASKNMRKLYSTYKISRQKKEEKKIFQSDKKIRILLVQNNPAPYSDIMRKQSSKSVEQLGPWGGEKV